MNRLPFALGCMAMIVLGYIISCAETNPADSQHYDIIHKIVLQPVDHSNPEGPKLKQHVDILIPDGAPPDSPVFFNLGNETDLTDATLLKFYRLHGERDDIIYIQAEHRGYGQTLTNDEDQSVPTYVRVEQVLSDTRAVITQLKEDYPGPWMAAGWSYGGALVIEYAYKYPEDVAVILSSSGVVDWPFLEYGYDRQVLATLGEACYERLARHSANLEPEAPFDEVWLEREFLHATTQGIVQYPYLEKLQPYFTVLTYLPTDALISVLHRMDDIFGDGEGWRYARATGATSIGPAEIAEGIHNWHVWRYQICSEIGGFLASETEDGLFIRTREDFCEECRIQFGEEPQAASGPEWSQREKVAQLTVPLIYVAGGMDPWLDVSLEPDYEIRNGKYFFVPEGRHCPEREDPELARAVLEEMLKYAQSESQSDSLAPEGETSG